MYYKIHLREEKLDQRWKPYYRILKQTGPASFVIWDQMAGTIKRAHANDLELAEKRDWGVTEPQRKEKWRRKVTLVESEMETDEDSEEEEREGSHLHIEILDDVSDSLDCAPLSLEVGGSSKRLNSDP